MSSEANRRLDERVSARFILASLVSITLCCGLLAALLTFTRLSRANRLASAHQEAEVLARAAALVLEHDLGENNPVNANSHLETLAASSSLTAVCIRIFDQSDAPQLSKGKFRSSCEEELPYERSYRIDTSDRGHISELKRVSVTFNSKQNILNDQNPSIAYQAYSILLVLAFAALILVLIYLTVRFGSWVFDELQLTITGRRDAPPSLLQTLRIIELERVWETVDKLNEVTRSKALIDVSTRVAHDIRSPVSALNMVVSTLGDVPEAKRVLIRNAANRINDIANDLVRQSKALKSANPDLDCSSDHIDCDLVMLVALVDSVISEKRLQYRERNDLEIEADLSFAYGLFCRVNVPEISRAISNLIDNAAEAIAGAGKISVAVRSSNKVAQIAICDTGRGMAPEVLERVGQKGFSYGKGFGSAGLGLGVSYARESVERFGGRLSIQSKELHGTIVSLFLPQATAPEWFVERLELSKAMAVLSIDDDTTVHQAWSGRFDAEGLTLNHIRFTSLEAFKAWGSKHDLLDALYLFDYEFLGQAEDGLSVITKLGLQDRSILVTSRYDDRSVRERADAEKVCILPKTLVNLVPIYAS